MLEPWQVQISNTGSSLMSMSSPNPTKVVFEVLRGTVVLYYEPPSKVTHLSCCNHRMPICALGFNSDTNVNECREEIGTPDVCEEWKGMIVQVGCLRISIKDFGAWKELKDVWFSFWLRPAQIKPCLCHLLLCFSRQISILKLQWSSPSSTLSDGKIQLFHSSTQQSFCIKLGTPHKPTGEKIDPLACSVFLPFSTVTEQMHPLSFPIFLSL